MGKNEPSDEILKTAEEIGRLLREIHRGLRCRIKEGDSSGLTVPQTLLMGIVFHHPGLTLTELSRLMGLANSTVSGIVDRLERDGLLERVPDLADRRIFRVNPTPKAKAQQEKWATVYRDVIAEILGRLPPEEIPGLKRSLTMLARAVSANEGHLSESEVTTP